MAFLAGPRLLDWASSPPHLQFNKFVLTGYRPASSGSGCLRSLFYMHNELGNIYTHGELHPAPRTPHPQQPCPRRGRGPKAEESPSAQILGCPGPGTARSRSDKAAIVPDVATRFCSPGGRRGKRSGGPSPLNPSEPWEDGAWCPAT